MNKKYSVTGMTCAACQAHVQKAVEKINGVKNVNVNLLSNSMIVEFDESLVNDQIIFDAVKNAGYGASEFKKETKEKKKTNVVLIKLIVAFVLLILVMYVSMGHMVGLPLPPFLDGHHNAAYFALAQLVLVLPIIIMYRHFFVSGFKKLFKLSPNMDSLIALSATVSLIYGIVAIALIIYGLKTGNDDLVKNYHMNLYFESAGMILTFVSLGKYLENASKNRTKNALQNLMDLAPKKAVILRDNNEIEVAIEEVKVGDVVIVKKGAMVPVDGIIVDGTCSIDEANVTGESMPVLKSNGDKVYSSTISINGYAKIQAQKVGEDTSIATIIKMVEEASNSKAPISKLVDKISRIFVPVVMGISLLSLIISLICGATIELAFNFMVSVLVIACPCALGLATPVAIMVGTGVGAKNGLLIKNAEILERTHLIKTVVLDKTGTITYGKPKVVDFINYSEDDDLISVVYSLENKSEHPLAQAILDFSVEKDAKLLDISDFEAIDGEGIKGVYLGNTYRIGNEKMLANIDADLQNQLNKYASEGKTVLFATKNDKLQSIITLKDEIKPNSKVAIQELKKMGIKVVMLTGDNEKTARQIANEVGIDEVIAGVLPIDKKDVVDSLKKDKKHLVAMVGDGVNDALALTYADLGISLKGGSDIAKETSDIVLLKDDLLDVVNVIKLSRRTLRTIKGNLFWAYFYNCVGIIIASGLLYPISHHIKLTPMIGSLAMSLSSVFVVTNALTINLFKTKQNKKEKEDENMEITLKVEGMMCGHCKAHVENALLKVDGVKSAVASLEKENVVVELIKEVDKQELIKAIDEAGYKAM